MATDVLGRSSVDRCGKMSILDPRINRMLWHLEDDAKRSVIEELVFELEFDELMEARDALFEEVTTSGEWENGANPPRMCLDALLPGSSRPIAIPWKLIKRRAPTIAADDLCELYLYSLDPSKGFPYKMLKRKALSSMKRDTISEDPSMSIIVEQDGEIERAMSIVLPNASSPNHRDISEVMDNISLLINESFPGIDNSNESMDMPSNEPGAVTKHNDVPSNELRLTAEREPLGHEKVEAMQIGFWETSASSVMQNHSVSRPANLVVETPTRKDPAAHSVLAPSGASSVPQSVANESCTHTRMGASVSSDTTDPSQRIDQPHTQPPTAVNLNPARGVEPVDPTPPVPLSVDKSTATYVEMATQTGPNVIYDPPVTKSEFTSQMDYIDRSLIDHERRMRANELRNERGEQKVNKIDADIYTMYNDLCLSHEALIDDHNNLKSIVADILKVSPIYERLITQDESALSPAVNPSVITIDKGTGEDPIPRPEGLVGPNVPRYAQNQHIPKAIAVQTQIKPPSTHVDTSKLVKVAAPGGRDSETITSTPADPGMPKKVAVACGRDTDAPTASAKGNRGPSAKPIPAKYPPTETYALPQNPNREKRPGDKKRPENPEESFLKEARRVIPNSLPKRTPL